MRLHRERRRQGLRCLTIELRETEVIELTKRGFLRSENQNEPEAVRKAFYVFLDRALEARLWCERVVFNRSRSWHGAGRQPSLGERGVQRGRGRHLFGAESPQRVAPLGLKAGLDRTGRLQP